MRKISKRCFKCCKSIDFAKDDYQDTRVSYVSGRSYIRYLHKKCVPEYFKALKDMGGKWDTVAAQKWRKEIEDAQKIQLCIGCGKIFQSGDDILIAENGKKRLQRFHTHCYTNYQASIHDIEKMTQESSDWDKAYNYFVEEVLGVKNRSDIKDSYIAKRLLGLKLGKFEPTGADIVKGVERGYSYQTIYYTMLLIKPQMQKDFENKRFSNMRHMVNYALVVMKDKIDFMDKQVRAMVKQKELTARIETQTKEEIELSNVRRRQFKVNKNKGKAKFPNLATE